MSQNTDQTQTTNEAVTDERVLFEQLKENTGLAAMTVANAGDTPDIDTPLPHDWRDTLEEWYGDSDKPLSAVVNATGKALKRDFGSNSAASAIKAAAQALMPAQTVKIEMEATGEVESTQETVVTDVNPWFAWTRESTGAEYGKPILKPDMRQAVAFIGRADKIAAIIEAGYPEFTYRLGAQLHGDKSVEPVIGRRIVLPDHIKFLATDYYLAVQAGDRKIASAEVRENFVRRTSQAVPEKMHPYLNHLLQMHDIKTDMQNSDGMQYTLNKGDFTTSGIARSIPNIIRLSAEMIATTNLSVLGQYLNNECEEYHFAIAQDPDVARIFGADPDDDDAASVLVNAGYPLAEVSGRWGDAQEDLWHYISSCPGRNTHWVEGLSRQFESVASVMEEYELRAAQAQEEGYVTGVDNAGAGFPDNDSVPPVLRRNFKAKQVNLLGFRIGISGSVTIS